MQYYLKDLLSKSYGKSFGRPPTVTKKTNGTVILENPELLKIKRDTAKVRLCIGFGRAKYRSVWILVHFW